VKSYKWIAAVAAVSLLLSACGFSLAKPGESLQGTPSSPSTTVPETQVTEPSEPPAPPVTEPRIGWYSEGKNTYYYDENGVMLTGWLELEGVRYYFKEDGTMARGKVNIDGVNNYFTSAGAYILLVNPWNFVPEGYAPDLVELSTSIATSGQKVDRSCYDALLAMITDCNRECPEVCVVSSVRTQEYQEGLFQRKINSYLDQGYPLEEATRLAATVIAVPGTSEHQLGLAVDIVDTRSWSLNDGQADLPAQKWLMENCWKYGFILRYPKGTTDSTGIIYEPWHYRYVGLAVAAEIHESGQTLEQYLESLS